MAKLYFNKTEISQHQGLYEMLMSLVENGIAQHEKQSSFRSLYDIEIIGVMVYYKKDWRYNSKAAKSELDAS